MWFQGSRPGQGAVWALVLVGLAGACSDPAQGTTVGTTAAGAGGDGGHIAQDAEPTPGLPLAAVYVARRGVSTPWLLPVGGGAPAGVGKPIQLGPRRGAGYGLGEGEVSYPDITPDGQHVVVVFYPMNTLSSSYGGSEPILFALPTDGSGADKPVRVARAPHLHATDRAYVSGRMAYLDGDSLYTARLDGSDAESPVLVATPKAGESLERPRWLQGASHLAYTARSGSGGQRALYVVAADGSMAAQPHKLSLGSGPAEHLAAVLPDGRVVVSGPDDRLYAANPLGAAEPVALTPAGHLPSYLGMGADGLRIAVELRQSWKKERLLVSVRTDGSDADAPVALTPTPAAQLHAVVSRDGLAVAWRMQAADGRWTVWRRDLAGAQAAVQAAPWEDLQLQVTAYDHGAGALLGARKDGAVLRFATAGAAAQPAQVLAKVSDLVNQSMPWPVLSEDGAQVTFTAQTKAGWTSWTVPLAGGTPVALAGPWYADLITPWGVLTRESVQEGAAFVTDLQGGSRRVTPWHAARLVEAHLSADSQRLLYACDAPQPGWYAAALSADEAEAPAQPTLVMPVSVAGEAQNPGWQVRPLSVDDHLVRRAGARLESYAANGAHADDPLVLAEAPAGGSVATHLVADPLGKRVVFTRRGPPGSGATEVLSIGVRQALKDPTLVVQVQGQVARLGLLPGTSRVLVLTYGGPGAQSGSLMAAAADGGDAAKPQILAHDLPGEVWGVWPTSAADYVVTVHSTQPTAVPHPDALFAIGVPQPGAAGSDPAHPIAPMALKLWPEASWSPHPSGMTALRGCGPGGAHLLLQGPKGLYSARLDGEQVAAPPWLGPVVGQVGASLSPDGQQVLTGEAEVLHLARVGAQGSQRALNVGAGGAIHQALWSPSGAQVIFRAGAQQGWPGGGALFAVDTSATAATATALTPTTFAVSSLQALVPGRPLAVVESTQGWDHSLYLVPLDGSGAGSAPPSLTPVDDTSEALVGFVVVAAP